MELGNLLGIVGESESVGRADVGNCKKMEEYRQKRVLAFTNELKILFGYVGT